MTLRPVFYNRDFSYRPVQSGGLAVASARWAAVGGPDLAALESEPGFRLGMAGLLDLLRCPVKLVEDGGAEAWWGYVDGFSLRDASPEVGDGRLELRCSLSDMANSVKVMFRDTEARDDQKQLWSETSWADDNQSQAIYGEKEQVYRLPFGTLGHAEGLREVLLDTLSWPVVAPVVANLRSGRTLIHLKGWWHTIGWRVYNSAAGLIEYDFNPDGEKAWGDTGANTQTAQSFTCAGSGWELAGVWIKIKAVGAPADNLTVDLCSDNAGVPGTVRASITLAGGSVPLEYTWVKFTFSSAYAASAGTWWVRLGRSGANDGANYYLTKADLSQGYAGGKMMKWDGANWTDRTPGADMLFRVFGTMATTSQISLAAANGIGGQFLGGVRIVNASGVSTNPFREDNRPASEEIADLLQAGNSSRVRMLAEVTSDRTLRVYSQPGAAAAVLRVNTHGRVLDRFGRPVPAWTKAAGEWLRVDELAGVGSSMARVKDAVFVEAVEWDGQGLRISE